jgi:hypothetical protein
VLTDELERAAILKISMETKHQYNVLQAIHSEDYGTDEKGPFVQKPNIMTIESLEAYGFREWPVAEHDKHNRHWSFCKRDKKGKKLHVQIHFWDFSKYSTAENKVLDSFSGHAQFDMNGPKTFNVDISVNDMTPDQVVDWFDRMHELMGCSYYELYSDEDEYNDEGVRVYFSCQECGKFLPPEEAKVPFLCPSCLYERDTGFKKPKLKRK